MMQPLHRWSSLIRFGGLAASLFMVGQLAGCAGSSTFTAYPKKVEPLVQSMQARQEMDLQKLLLDERGGSDGILYNMEYGRYALIFNKIDQSRTGFEQAITRIEKNDQKATVSASDAGAVAAAVAVNDNAIPYSGEGYERVLVHHYQALGYLKQKNLEGAGVEVRRANAEQEAALAAFEKEIAKAQAEAQKNKVNTGMFNAQYAQLDEVAGSVKNSFQNAYTFYLSGMVYELIGQPNDAYIDYKKALEIFPQNQVVQRDVLRLARSLSMTEDYQALKARFNKVQEAAVPKDGYGEVVVLYEEGLAPRKQELKLSIPIPSVGMVSAAMPMYNERLLPAKPLRLSLQGKALSTTEPICDVKALAVKALKERVPMIATRQIVRTVAKAATQKLAQQKGGDLGGLVASVYNLVSENADLRSWLTLPSNAQITRVSLPAGQHTIGMHQIGTNVAGTLPVEVLPGGKTVVHVVAVGPQLYTTATPLAYNR